MSDQRVQRKPEQLSLFTRATKNAAWVARHLKTSPQTVGRMIEAGELEAYKLRERGPWHIFLDSVEELEKKIRDRHGLQAAPKGAKSCQ
jgi:helix-turn-helix protein